MRRTSTQEMKSMKRQKMRQLLITELIGRKTMRLNESNSSLTKRRKCCHEPQICEEHINEQARLVKEEHPTDALITEEFSSLTVEQSVLEPEVIIKEQPISEQSFEDFIMLDSNVAHTSKEDTFNTDTLDLTIREDLQHLLELAEQNLRVNDTDLELLRNLRINITWEIPFSHSIETRMSSNPTRKQQQEFNRLPIPMTTGFYTTSEDETIKKNWNDFIKVNNLPDNPGPFLTFTLEPKNKTTTLSKSERIKFVQFLGQGLEHRMLNSIYRRFKTLMQSYKKGKFTAVEDDIILKYLKTMKSSKVHSDLAKLLQRTRDSVQKRCDYLSRNGGNTENPMEVAEETVVDELEDPKITLNQCKDI